MNLKLMMGLSLAFAMTCTSAYAWQKGTLTIENDWTDDDVVTRVKTQSPGVAIINGDNTDIPRGQRKTFKVEVSGPDQGEEVDINGYLLVYLNYSEEGYWCETPKLGKLKQDTTVKLKGRCFEPFW